MALCGSVRDDAPRERAVALAGKTYVNPSVDKFVELPDYRAGSGRGAVTAEKVWGETCEKHHIKRARNGTCGMCFD
jgi:hypothetical protein